MAITHNAGGAAAVNIQDGGNSLTVDGTVTTNAGTGFAPIVTDGAAAGTQGIHLLGTDGTNAQILSTTTTGALNIADDGGSITVDGTVASTQSGAWAVEVNNAAGAAAVNIQDGGNSITVDGTVTANAGTGFPPVVTDGAAAGTTGIHLLGTDGTNAQILSTDATGALNVVGTFTSGSEYAEDTAHTTGDLGTFVLAVRNDLTAARTSADGDYSAAVADEAGRLVALPYAAPPSTVSGRTGAFNSAADQALIAAGGAGLRNYITGVTLGNTSDATVVFTLKDGATALYDVVVDARTSQSVDFLVPLRGTAATAFNVATDAAIASAYASATGYRSAV